MAGLRKPRIADRIATSLEESGVSVDEARFTGLGEELLPWNCLLRFSGAVKRRYSMYFWTIGHGGRSRSQTEYRIQTKLGTQRRLSFQHGTTILLGYYLESEDKVGKDLGNEPPSGMEVFVAWNPVGHLRLGSSSSCQVPFAALTEAHEWGGAVVNRKIAGGVQETVFCMRPEHLDVYLRMASGGHEGAETDAFLQAVALERVKSR